MKMLKVEKVSKTFGGLHALSDVTLIVQKGTILGLIGSNGSGKSTLVNVITGVLKPDDGHVFLGDVEITGWSPESITRLGIARTYQTARIFSEPTVMENIEASVMTAKYRQFSVDQEVELLLQRLSLSSWAYTKSKVLPYGTQRRLEIARALGSHPEFLLLDEPAAGLNDEESNDMLKVINGIREDPELGCGILIIDHDLRLIMRLCDYVHVLNEGQTIAEGLPNDVRHNSAVINSYLGSSENID